MSLFRRRTRIPPELGGDRVRQPDGHTLMAWRYHDGERPKDCSQEIADCAIRAITIATGEPYTLVAGRLQQIEVALAEEENKHWLAALGSVFAGCSEEAIALYFNEIGWTYFAWPGGETVPFCEDNMPHKPAVANLKTHVVAVLYRVVLDMTNPQLVTTNGLQVTWRRLHGFWAPR